MGGALELLEHVILLDAGRDDDARGDTEPLAREVDLLGRLCALELVDLKRVAIDTAKGEARGVSAGADTKANTLGAAAYSRLEILVSLRTAASAEAPWSPIELPKRLQRWGGARMVREHECQRALT